MHTIKSYSYDHNSQREMKVVIEISLGKGLELKNIAGNSLKLLSMVKLGVQIPVSVTLLCKESLQV